MTMYGVKFSDTKKVYSKEEERAATPGPSLPSGAGCRPAGLRRLGSGQSRPKGAARCTRMFFHSRGV